jgi:hypothetical protein
VVCGGAEARCQRAVAAKGTGTVCAEHPLGRCAANGASPLCDDGGTGTVCAEHPLGRCAANGASPLCDDGGPGRSSARRRGTVRLYL